MNIDRNIILKCKNNDKIAFMELFRYYERYLYTLCYSYVQNQQDALDITQEIYIKLLKNINMYNDRYPFHPWIRKIAVNTCINFKRSNKRDIISINTEYEEQKSLEEQIAANSDIEKEVEANDMRSIIQQHLSSLSPKYRMVIMLRYYEDLSYDEIAAIMKIPLGTVKTDLHRARNILKDRLSTVILDK